MLALGYDGHILRRCMTLYEVEVGIGELGQSLLAPAYVVAEHEEHGVLSERGHFLHRSLDVGDARRGKGRMSYLVSSAHMEGDRIAGSYSLEQFLVKAFW